jgi:hypothetical protein
MRPSSMAFPLLTAQTTQSRIFRLVSNGRNSARRLAHRNSGILVATRHKWKDYLEDQSRATSRRSNSLTLGW